MEYIYTIMLLNELKKEVNEDNIKAVLKAVGVDADQSKVKSLIGALDGVNIEEVVKSSSAMQMQAPATTQNVQESKTDEAPKEEKKEAPKIDAAAGLGSLF